MYTQEELDDLKVQTRQTTRTFVENLRKLTFHQFQDPKVQKEVQEAALNTVKAALLLPPYEEPHPTTFSETVKLDDMLRSMDRQSKQAAIAAASSTLETAVLAGRLLLDQEPVGGYPDYSPTWRNQQESARLAWVKTVITALSSACGAARKSLYSTSSATYKALTGLPYNARNERQLSTNYQDLLDSLRTREKTCQSLITEAEIELIHALSFAEDNIRDINDAAAAQTVKSNDSA